MKSGEAPFATVLVSPRDSYEHNLRCLDRLLECTTRPRRIVCVDAGSPEPLASELAAHGAEADVALVRSDCVLTPKQGRTLGLEIARADEPPWVALLDNDAYVEPGWLEGLCACGGATGAAFVMPLVCIGSGGCLPTMPARADTLEFGAWLRARAYLPDCTPFTRIADRRGRYPPRLVHRPSCMEMTSVA